MCKFVSTKLIEKATEVFSYMYVQGTGSIHVIREVRIS
jgi:hypothetical protein